MLVVVVEPAGESVAALLFAGELIEVFDGLHGPDTVRADSGHGHTTYLAGKDALRGRRGPGLARSGCHRRIWTSA